MVNNKVKRVDKDAVIGCAFIFMGKAFLTNDEINSYLEIVSGLLPENHILFGVSDPAKFVAERYGVITPSEEGYFVSGTAEEFNYYFIFRTPSYLVSIYKEACEILKSIEEMSDEVTTSENITLKKTI